jgi:hypothetical protein
LPSRDDSRTLRLDKYARRELLPQPKICLWQEAVGEWGVMGNNDYGNCVIATAGHAILSWSANAQLNDKRITDEAVVELSREMGALDGYNILNRLKWWRKKGMWGNYLWAFAAVDMTDRPLVQDAINAFGLCDIGLNLPRAWVDSEVWDVGTGREYRPDSWGGHSVPLVGYDESYVYCVTWGEVQPITWAALPYYSDEGYALIDPSWLAGGPVCPSGFDLVQLHADLKALDK